MEKRVRETNMARNGKILGEERQLKLDKTPEMGRGEERGGPYPPSEALLQILGLSNIEISTLYMAYLKAEVRIIWYT